MIIIEIQKMIESFPTEVGLHAFQPVLSKRIGAVWDHLRWFLAAHYRYNDRFDTDFWRACRGTANVSGVQELIDLYTERAPIGSTPARFEELDDSTFGVFRHDLLFMGQRLPTTYAKPEQTRAAWRRISAANDRVVARAVDHRAGLRVVRDHPDVLRRHVQDLD
jgi:tryptophan halogenase